jgi:hypothetical protein
MDATSRCDACVASPKLIPMPSSAFPGAFPASVAWLQSQDPRAFMDLVREVRSLFASKNLDAIRSLAESMKTSGVHPPGLLATVIVSLAARGRIRLFEVTHRPGFASRLFGAKPVPTIHVAPSPFGDSVDGIVEQKLVTGTKAGNLPHGPALRDLIESLFPKQVPNPGADIVTVAQQDAIDRGVGRWIPKEEIPPMADESGGMIERLLEKLLAHRIGEKRFYQILKPQESAVASEFDSLAALRNDTENLKAIENEILEALRSRTYTSSD